ncbi:hypothetical protein MSG34_21245 [Vibrio sp. 1CM2L]|uniref:hypothetical protein n=1 Tax=Vibrio sp. 1CM2L TaxID=2929166 RepID=UPI0020C0B02E|nr:hypothetical protein [Vibrio sp. 1CM2L]MCK8078696.1 hypothetical protein [Vibrio sp. 1CM2L]
MFSKLTTKLVIVSYYFRDKALLLERDNLKISLFFMRIAKLFNRNGEFIERKLSEYSSERSYHERPVSVLHLRHAGVGDILKQISKFYWVCEYYSLKPMLYFIDKKGRNEILISEVLRELGFDNSHIVGGQLDGTFHPFKDIVKLPLSDGSIAPCYFHYTLDCYFDQDIEDILNRINPNGIPNPRLLKIISNSNLTQSIRQNKSTETPSKKRICVHVRRGDVAQVKLSSIRNLLAKEVDTQQWVHVKGLYRTQKALIDDVPKGNSCRFKELKLFEERLCNLTSRFSQFEVVFTSDGMTKLTKSLLAKKEIFCRDVSFWELERSLEKELFPIIKLSSFCLIGENQGNLWDSVKLALSSDIIVTSSPGLFLELSRYIDPTIKFEII